MQPEVSRPRLIEFALVTMSVVFVLRCQAYPVASMRGVYLAAQGTSLGLIWLLAGRLVRTGSWSRSIQRVSAGFCLAVLCVALYRAAVTPELFVDKSSGEVSTFWPVVYVALLGVAFYAHVLLGSLRNMAAVFGRPTPRTLSWWLGVALWLGYSVYVMVGHVTPDVVHESVQKGGFPAGVTAVVVLLLLAKKYIKPWQPPPPLDRKMALEAIGEERRRELLDLLDRSSRASGKYLLSYWPADEGCADPYARIGGNPLALPEERWPTATAAHMRPLFLLQLVLRAPRLPVPWQGRLLSIFLQDEGVLYVCSYAPEDLERLVPLVHPVSEHQVREVPLRELALPDLSSRESDGESEEEWLDLSCERLMELHPELRAELAPFPDPHDKNRMSAALLAGRADTTWLWFPSDAILVGGAPSLYSRTHPALCRRCKGDMRFLLEFLDVTEGMLGDGATGYVYGCDAHPECCAVFVESA